MVKWEPSRELIAWGKKHYGGMPLDSIWAPDDSALQYRKLSETRFVLFFIVDHPIAHDYHQKFSLLMEACGYSVGRTKEIQILESDSDTE